MITTNTIKKSIYASAGALTLVASQVFAQGNRMQTGFNSVVPAGTNFNLTAQITTVFNLIIFTIGFLAVAMLVLGGFRYVFSAGNEKTVESAKNTILYAIIGIIIAIMAWSIVTFVIMGSGVTSR